jgi:hypothetical protein
MPSTIRASVVVIGCEHNIQRTGNPFAAAETQARHEEQQRHFRTLLMDSFRHGVAFVGEEINANSTSIARLLAEEYGRGYALIDMPMEERKKNGCIEQYKIHILADGGTDADVLRCHRLREQYMCQRIIDHTDGDTALVLVGDEHAARLANDLGEEVALVKCKSVTNYAWFDRQLYNYEQQREISELDEP